MRTLLFTGATGSLAPFLLHELLHKEEGDDTRFACLVRSADGPARLARRIEALCPACAARVESPRVTFVEGDVTSPIAFDGRLDAVWHFASDLRMDPAVAEDVAETNLEGAKNVLALCVRTGATLYDVSTAYVCGTRSGLVREDELEAGQGFRNAYEASKAKAEGLVRAFLASHPGIVFRPSIVVGDTRTGVSLTFQGFYRVLWAVRRLRDRLDGREAALALPCASPLERVNLVGADYVTDLLLRLHALPSALGKTFHLVNPDPPSLQDLLDLCADLLGFRGMVLVPEGEERRGAGLLERARSTLNRHLGDQVMVYFPYLAGNHPEFAMENVASLLGGVPAHPRLDAETWRRLYAYAEERDFAGVY